MYAHCGAAVRKLAFPRLKPGSWSVAVVGNKNGTKIDELSSVTIQAGEAQTLAL